MRRQRHDPSRPRTGERVPLPRACRTPPRGRPPRAFPRPPPAARTERTRVGGHLPLRDTSGLAAAHASSRPDAARAGAHRASWLLAAPPARHLELRGLQLWSGGRRLSRCCCRDTRAARPARRRAAHRRVRLGRIGEWHQPAARAATRGCRPRPRDWEHALGAAGADRHADQGAARLRNGAEALASAHATDEDVAASDAA
mmetsp:Transcript_17449/g.43884  ORF Transcript_17449/g.43884 Transcript_17449/m.43884 type:complete len:200 (+) Transcript_17449:381-980(+)